METVVKRVLPYLTKRGYDPDADIDFQTAVSHPERYAKGYVDLLVTCGKTKPQFVIEAKRSGKRLTVKDHDQALGYGRSLKVSFVAVTNGQDIHVLNVATGAPIKWNGKLVSKLPTKAQLPRVLAALRADKTCADIALGDPSLPFRPPLPLPQLNALFSRCHSKIRSIEKNEEHAFADLSKILFLKLLEEKVDRGDIKIEYSYRFHELAARPAAESDQVKNAITSMLEEITSLGYGDVIIEPLRLKNPKTFHYIVNELAGVSFDDSGLDTKGAAFEYFVRATLKGKRLGQYFTPRALVDLMAGMVGREAVVNALRAGSDVRVVDPACGTGGFLVYMMKASLAQLDALLDARTITKATHGLLAAKLKNEVFHGGDANDAVAAAARMNMIVAGDGHTNIRAEDTLRLSASTWSLEPTFDFILTNPPFGTSERSSLPDQEMREFPVPGGKGQHLFLQRMIKAVKPGGYVCTVIDEGLLNTESASALRRWIMANAELLAVVRLPAETFKPNKINVRSSVLLLRRCEDPDIELDRDYPVAFCDLSSLGYHGSGEPIRGFDFDRFRAELDKGLLDHAGAREGYHWRAFDVPARDIAADPSLRWDLKYWLPELRAPVNELQQSGAPTIGTLNTITTRRGKSPAASTYVDDVDGYAVVVKAGMISKFGSLMFDSADYIEKHVYDEMPEYARLQRGDVLLASTGTGTLGKACVYDRDDPAVADGHVTVLRVQAAQVDPTYLADYLRCGFGHIQVARLFTGSTGLIELTPEDAARILVQLPPLKEQRARSSRLRQSEAQLRKDIEEGQAGIERARRAFAQTDEAMDVAVAGLG